MASAVATRTRAEKVRENDQRLRHALERIIVETGWSSVTFTGVAKRAGLTVGALYARAENTSELGNNLWADSIEEFFATSIDQLLSGIDRGDIEEIRAFATDWDRKIDKVSVVVELLVASLFDDELNEGVGQSVRRLLAARCQPESADDAHRAAVATLMLSFFLGRALALRTARTLPPLTEQQFTVFSQYAAAPPARLGPQPRPELHFLREPTGSEIDPTPLDHSVIEVLGRVGWRRSTVARIARAAGISKGSLFSHFDTKAQLVAEAASRTVLTQLEVWSQYEPVVKEHGPLVARAMFLAEFLRPEHRDMWRINLELAHIALTVPEFAPFAVPSDTLPHTHLGVMLVACFVDGLDALPYSGPFGGGGSAT